MYMIFNGNVVQMGVLYLQVVLKRSKESQVYECNDLFEMTSCSQGALPAVGSDATGKKHTLLPGFEPLLIGLTVPFCPSLVKKPQNIPWISISRLPTIAVATSWAIVVVATSWAAVATSTSWAVATVVTTWAWCHDKAQQRQSITNQTLWALNIILRHSFAKFQVTKHDKTNDQHVQNAVRLKTLDFTDIHSSWMLQGNCWDRSSPAQKLLLGGKRMNGLGGISLKLILKMRQLDWDIQWFSAQFHAIKEA